MVDKKGAGGRWDWVPVHMPGVYRQMQEHRRKLGDAHVNECWRRGVVERQAGWFFAREGPIALGVPWGDDPVMRDFAAASITSGQSLVVIRPVGGATEGASS